MHSSLVRVQNVFGFFTTVAFAVAAAIALSVIISPQTPSAKLELFNVQVVKGRPHYYSSKKEEYAHIRFSLDADLTSLFNWNTKQVFAYITATYPSNSPGVPDSEAVIWDAIIPSLLAPEHQNQYVHPSIKSSKPPKKSSKKTKSKSQSKAYPLGASPGILRLDDQRPKYQITDVSGMIAERQNATLHLHWNVQPRVGALVWTNKRDILSWKALQGGESASFEFPPLKGTASVKKEDLKTETGGERNRGSPA